MRNTHDIVPYLPWAGTHIMHNRCMQSCAWLLIHRQTDGERDRETEIETERDDR